MQSSLSPGEIPQEQEDVVLTSTIELPKSGNTAIVVTLNRPSQKNCFNTMVVYKLAQIFSDIANTFLPKQQQILTGEEIEKEESDIAAIIFTGNGTSFCAGADLANPPNPIQQSSDLPSNLQYNPVYQMSRIPVPIIGSVHGHVITGGMELALACDILVGDNTTTFRDTHVKFGLAPCWGLSQKLSKRIGPGRAKMMSYTAKPISANLAYSWGLLDVLADNDKKIHKPSSGTSLSSSLERAIQIADDIGRNDMKMVGRYKRAVEEGNGMDLQKGLHRERELAISHYIEALHDNDGSVFQTAKDFITDDNRPRSKL